jgi:hypothetical protein
MAIQQSSWLAGEDFTTPANGRRAAADHAPPDGRQQSVRTGRADAVVFLAAVWLVVASVPVAYESTGRFDVFWNDVVVGIALGVVTMSRLVGQAATPSTAGINCALGTWLVAAPFLLGHGVGGGDQRSLWNDLVVGIAIVTLTVGSMATTKVRPQADTALDSRSPGLVVGAVEPAE